jgi:hypothetical protein
MLDEAHYLKHANAQRTQFLLGPNGYARRLPLVWAASGTPVSKNPYEYWTPLSSLFPKVALAHGLRTHEDFKARFCVVRPRYLRGKTVEKIMPELRNEAEFREILAETMLRRTLDDLGFDVPPLDFQIVRLDAQGSGPALEWDELQHVRRIKASIEAGDLESIAEDPYVARMRRRLGELKVAPVAEMLQSQLATVMRRSSCSRTTPTCWSHSARCSVALASLSSMGMCATRHATKRSIASRAIHARASS